MSQLQKNSPDIEKWLRLRYAKGVGPVAFRKLLDFFGSVDDVLAAPAARLAKVEGIGPKTSKQIAQQCSQFNIEKELYLARKLGVYLLHIDDPRYPPVLKRIYDPPPILYVKGVIEKQDNLAVAIVGSRRCSQYGREQASKLAHLLASAGFTIVSGMARGIDTAAHEGALSAKGRTMAVQGCGLAHIFPPENKNLCKMIAQTGACVSELPLGSEPLSQHFPGRNRIIAGLSLGTIVIEAGLRSGAMITASAAASYDREVMAVPGKIDSPISKGPHQLIKDGAVLIESVEDVLDAIGPIVERLKGHAEYTTTEASRKVEQPLLDFDSCSLSSDEKKVYQSLDGEEAHIEDVIEASELPAGAVNSALISLRLKGLIKQLPGNLFVRRKG